MGAATHHHPHRLSSVTVCTVLAPPSAVRAAASDSKSVARSDHESCGQVGRAVGEGGHALRRTGRDFVSQPGLTSVLELGFDATVLQPSPAAFPLPLSPLLGYTGARCSSPPLAPPPPITGFESARILPPCRSRWLGLRRRLGLPKHPTPRSGACGSRASPPCSGA
jgi:hypothetical protein